MPPSPASRCSPGREIPGKNHRRGHSMEYGILFREKDDDLALFSEMQNKERENFLLQPCDDLEDAFSSKLKHFSEFTIPVQGESSRLLSADGDKNDYDWLLTPPDTPLFPSLDDERPLASAASRGRPRGQISLSRSSTMEKSHRSSKGSASPNRLSLSPRSSSMHQMRGRTSSAHQPTSTSALPAATPVRRTSPSPSKPSRPASRSSTPTSRRMSTGSSTLPSTAIRGTSPARSSRGSSASPKIKAWQSNIPGFSLDAPPNLRTSLADRPASYVRGSSPASRNGRDSASRHSRQSVSPTASRSVSSSHSHERDRFSSHSKGSVASSGDDDLDSLQSIPLGGSDRPFSKRASLSPNNRTPRSSKLLSPSSVPKRPFESALRQMDQHKSHRNMFRPLVSSVPSTGLYTGKDSSSYHHIILRHPTVTIGGGASSGRVTGFMPDAKGSELLHDHHMESEASDIDMVDLLNKGNKCKNHESPLHSLLRGPDQGNAGECNSGVTEVNHNDVDVEINSASGSSPVVAGVSGVALEILEVCSRCGCHFPATDAVANETSLCPDCREQHDLMKNALLGTTVPLTENSLGSVEERKLLVETNSATNTPERLQQSTVKAGAGAIETQDNITEERDFCEEEHNYLQENTVSEALTEGDGERLNHQQESEQPSSDCSLLNRDIDGTKTLPSDEHCDLKVDSSEAGFKALLIKRSSSMKLPSTPAKNSSAITRSYDDFSFAREKSTSLRSSTEHATASLSSSSDYGSSIQKKTHVRRQSGNTPDVGSHRSDINFKSLGSMSPSSGMSGQASQGISSDVFAVDMTCNDEGTHQESQLQIQDSGNKEAGAMNSAFGESSRSICISSSELSSNVVDAVAESDSVTSLHTDNKGLYEDGDDETKNLVSIGESDSVTSLHNDDNKGLYEDGDDEAKNLMNTKESGKSPVAASSSLDDGSLLQDSSIHQEKDGTEISDHGSSSAASEIEPERCEQESPGSEFHDEVVGSESNRDETQDCSDLCSAEKDVGNSAVEHNSSAPADGILDNSTVLVECLGGREPKSLTLEEATDTILFCSSIVHDLAYRAATLAIEEQEDVDMEDSRPTVKFLGRPKADRGVHTRGVTKAKHSSKSTKARQKQMETEVKASSPMENDENAGDAMIRNVGVVNKGDSLKPPPKLESKCNCSIM